MRDGDPPTSASPAVRVHFRLKARAAVPAQTVVEAEGRRGSRCARRGRAEDLIVEVDGSMVATVDDLERLMVVERSAPDACHRPAQRRAPRPPAVRRPARRVSQVGR